MSTDPSRRLGLLIGGSLKQTAIHLRRDSFEFSAAHMTVYNRDLKEPLHGHNFQVQLEVGLLPDDPQGFIPFQDLKKAVHHICHQWNEKVILARTSPYLVIDTADEQTRFRLCGKEYSLPSEEIVWLGVDNITTENLSREFLTLLLAAIDNYIKAGRISELSVRIEESPGQGSSTTWRR